MKSINAKNAYNSDDELPKISIKSIRINQGYQFTISDNGICIKAKYLDSVFEEFKKINGDFKGTGMGLFISKNIIQKHQGKIWVESEYEKGSAFHFLLPFHE